MSDDKSDDIVVTYSCIDCGQEFESRKELGEHETKHENLSKTDRPRTDRPTRSDVN